MTNPAILHQGQRSAPRSCVAGFVLTLASFGCTHEAASEPPSPAPKVVAPRPPPVEIVELGDAEISEAVGHALAIDELTPQFTIDITTHDGIVELSGTVDNLLAKARAMWVAESVKGVRAVVSSIVVEAEPVADLELANNVMGALEFDPAAHNYAVGVAAHDGLVTLSGEVASWDAKQIAEEVAASVRGVEAIDNKITIVYHPRSDAEIAAEIERRLADDTLVDQRQIYVAVDHGDVRLDGVVGSARERERASAHAWTAGVTSVDSEALVVDWYAANPGYVVRQPPRRSSDRIRAAIELAISHDPQLQSSGVLPFVEGSTVTLHGTVDNLGARHAAEQLARDIAGVETVVNRIDVTPPPDLVDDDIAAAIRVRLASHVYSDLRKIVVTVDHDGVVTLTGDVDSYYDKAEASDVASHARGVTFVRNLLRVVHPELSASYEPYFSEHRTSAEGRDNEALESTIVNDDAITQAIEKELYWNPDIDYRRVRVAVAHGDAILTGTVDSWRQREIATQDAYKAGARQVDNRLEVSY